MNIALYKQSIKSNWKILILFAAVITMYVSIMVTMYDPEMSEVFKEFEKMMPQMMAAFGMVSSSTTLIGFLASYLYGFILLVFPMVYIMITSNGLVVRHVDRGSMSYLLASPNKRSKIILTQASALVTGIFFLVAYASVLAITISALVFPGELDVKAFLILNLGLFCLQLFIGGLCFLASCIFDDVKIATIVGGGIAIVCYLFQSLANSGEKFANLKYATFFTLFDTDKLINSNTDGYIMIACLFACGILLFITGIAIFRKRDLHV